MQIIQSMFNRYEVVARGDNSFPNRETMAGSELLIDLGSQAYDLASSPQPSTQYLNLQHKSYEVPSQSEAFQDLLDLQDRASIPQTPSNTEQDCGHRPQTITPTCFIPQSNLGSTPNSDKPGLTRATRAKRTTKFHVDISKMPYIPPHERQKVANEAQYVPPHERQKVADKSKHVPSLERQKVTSAGQYVPPHMRKKAPQAEAAPIAATASIQVTQDDSQTITLFNITRTKPAPSQIEPRLENRKTSLSSTENSAGVARISGRKPSVWVT
jgi:hypothetical protein